MCVCALPLPYRKTTVIFVYRSTSFGYHFTLTHFCYLSLLFDDEIMIRAHTTVMTCFFAFGSGKKTDFFKSPSHFVL